MAAQPMSRGGSAPTSSPDSPSGGFWFLKRLPTRSWPARRFRLGLYTLLGSLIVYAIFGTTRQAVSAPTSGSSIMMAAVVAPFLVTNSRGTSGITRPTGPGGGDHLPAVRAAAAWVCHRIHFSFGHDRVHFRAGDPYRREPGSRSSLDCPEAMARPIYQLWHLLGQLGEDQLGDLHHRSRGPGLVVRP